MTEQRRERALMSLLDCSELPDPEMYPESIKLPSYLQDRSRELVRCTEADLRERSVNFRYSMGQWRGRLAFKGTTFNQDQKSGVVTARINRLAAFSLMLGVPDIFLHTHPSTESEQVRALREVWSQWKARDDKQPQKTEELLPFPPELYMLPSSQDLVLYCMGLSGVVGNMVSSEGGNFLLLRRNVAEPAFIRRVFQDLDARGKEPQTILNSAIQQTIEMDKPPHVTRDIILRAIGEAVVKSFHCYFSDDPESPHMTKLPNGTAGQTS